MNPSTSLGLRSRDKDKLIGQLSESLNDKISEVVRGQEMNHRLRVEVSEQVKLGETLSMDLNQQLQRKELEMQGCKNTIDQLNKDIKELKLKSSVAAMSNAEV